ncbi:hypothetical protein KGM_207753 [Danaus plexippus plexippus]|uniref:Uncharacterized protein n=1 Tax=Danaus plexippus plexippus TaxID=278856 RepID=A0A212FK02_DANPL|nr:protein xmas-2 [Danaus plexippus plexippus]OWR54073.1 hypothetical protein KGM_207753 [Danaus plexippus plexippus]
MDNSPQKKLRGSILDKVNNRTSITCSNVPDCLFEAKIAEKHFCKFGRVQRIRLLPKKHMCVIEYDHPGAAERAVLNAGAYDGFMFDVTRSKPRVRRKSSKDEDPDWVPDPEVEQELNAMSGIETYKVPRKKLPGMGPGIVISKARAMAPPIKKKNPIAPKRTKPTIMNQPANAEAPIVITATTLSNREAAMELDKLRSRVSITPDEKWRTLDARDRILRAWGGAGSRVKVGGATIGTCPDMCPEKELLHRQSEHQLMTLETIPGSDGLLEPWRAVKQYSRSSADQEIPMCYELRPARVLMRTCSYLLHEIADTNRQVTLADWFHFMWDRFRGIRKDITQQALCCAGKYAKKMVSESIKMVEICARFHAHCAARLADLEHTQFDQKLNTDNLTKCLQTLKHMYADVSAESKPNEAEFRGYIALLNLGDANFWWEIKQLPYEIQKSESITFALQIYAALDNNNYVRFFRLIQEKATYLQACILLRYFNDVRARALARIVKAYAPRGGARYPAEDMMNILAFESIESMKSFINHYGLRFAKNEEELTIILNRNQFIEDSDPYPLSRAINLIESKRQNTVGEIISGGQMPRYDFENVPLYSSFGIDGRLKEISLLAEDLGYNTINDSEKDVQGLKLEMQKLSQEGRILAVSQKIEPRKTLFVKQDDEINSNINKFSFQPPIPVAPTEVIANSPEKVLDSPKNIFTFSKPQKIETNVYQSKLASNLFSRHENDKYNADLPKPNVFASANHSKNVFEVAKSAFKPSESSDVFKKPASNSMFGQQTNKNEATSGNIFTKSTLFSQTDPKNIFSTARPNVFGKAQEGNDKSANIFSKPLQDKPSNPGPVSSIFGSGSNETTAKTTFKLGNNNANPVPYSNGDQSIATSPGSLFKSANQPSFPSNKFTIFQSKNKAQTVADNIFNSVKAPQTDVYDFDPNQENTEKLEEDMKQKMREEEMKRQDELKRQEEIKRLEAEKLALQRKEEERKREEQRRMEEAKKLEEIKKKEEAKKQEELKKKIEEQKRLELKRIAEEKERKFKERVEKESRELIEELVNEIEEETVGSILKEEVDDFNKLLSYARDFNENISMELLNEICTSELKAEIFRTKRIMKKWYYVWRKHFIRNFKRRSLLDDTPLWLPDRSPLQEARLLKRRSEKSALDNMNAIHRGYKFVGELKQLPSPKPYNILDIIRSPLIKRMKQIEYPYDKCFFWKALLVSPGANDYLHRKINVRKWVQEVFGDGRRHDISDCLIHVEKESWNKLMDFAISISLLNKDSLHESNEALSGANGILVYVTENDGDTDAIIELILKQKHQYQIIPIAVIMPNKAITDRRCLEEKLTLWQNNNVISAYKLFYVDSVNVDRSIDSCTKSALKWLSRNYPKPPPLEIDYLKSICQRYLGNDIWARLKSDKNERTNYVLKDLQKLVACYNTAVDKLCHVITNEDLFNYPSFPLEFVKYLDSSSPYPKPFEFIPSSAKQTDNTSFIRRLMHKLKLPDPSSQFLPKTILNMQEQIGKYCKQIGWFSNPEDVMCKVVALIPQELCDFDMPHEISDKHLDQLNLVDVLNVIVYEKINSLDNFDNRLAVYLKPALDEYRNTNFLLEVDVYAGTKHRALDCEDDLDYYIRAKRRKIASGAVEQLMLEDKECSLVEDNIQTADQSIHILNSCHDAVSELEKQLDEEKKKSEALENLLMMALSNI